MQVKILIKIQISFFVCVKYFQINYNNMKKQLTILKNYTHIKSLLCIKFNTYLNYALFNTHNVSFKFLISRLGIL